MSTVFTATMSSNTALGVPMMSPASLGTIRARRSTPALIDYGDGYSPAPRRLPQIDRSRVGDISNPFVTHNVPIGDAAYRGEAVTMPAANDVEYMADPDILNVQPMFEPVDGVREMVDPEVIGRADKLWAGSGWRPGPTSLAITTSGSLGTIGFLIASIVDDGQLELSEFLGVPLFFAVIIGFTLGVSYLMRDFDEYENSHFKQEALWREVELRGYWAEDSAQKREDRWTKQIDEWVTEMVELEGLSSKEALGKIGAMSDDEVAAKLKFRTGIDSVETAAMQRMVARQMHPANKKN